MTRLLIIPVCLSALLFIRADVPAGKIVYSNDFEKLATGKLPDDFLAVSGDFTIADVGGNKCIQLPGAPLDYCGLLFGPAEHAQVEVSARIWSDKTGKRLPEFGIGTGDVGGPRLWLVPAQRVVQIRKGDDVLATANCTWTAGTWTGLKIRVTQSPAGGAMISGSVTSSEKDTKPVKIECEDKEAPSAGHGSVWGAPFSDQPIRFDDLKVIAIGAAK